MNGDTVTLLCSYGRRLAKIIGPDGKITGYDSARTFDLFEIPVNDLAHLAGGLQGLLDLSTVCIVRGAILDPSRTKGVRRLLFRDPKTGDEPTLRDVARRWLALDFDNLVRPVHVNAADIPACASVAIALLPPSFHGVSCIVQATASHGIKPGLRLRLWYWLDRSTSGVELKTWLRAAPIDASIFGAVQPIYTAAPLFQSCKDPLPSRLARLSGDAAVRVPPPQALARPTHKRPPAAKCVHQADVHEHAYAALVVAAQRIASAAEGQRHRTLILACCGLVPLLHIGALDERVAREIVRRAAEVAGMDDRGEIDRAISWAFSRQVSPTRRNN